MPEHPEDRLVDKLSETADSVTQELRDLQDELLPPVAVEPAEPPVFEAPPSTCEPAAERRRMPDQPANCLRLRLCSRGSD